LAGIITDVLSAIANRETAPLPVSLLGVHVDQQHPATADHGRHAAQPAVPVHRPSASTGRTVTGGR
jgi:hypothetical protein